MPDYIARKRLKQKALERWENEGGKVDADSEETRGSNPTTHHETEGNRSSRSREGSSAGTRNPPGRKLKSRRK